MRLFPIANIAVAFCQLGSAALVHMLAKHSQVETPRSTRRGTLYDYFQAQTDSNMTGTQPPLEDGQGNIQLSDSPLQAACAGEETSPVPLEASKASKSQPEPWTLAGMVASLENGNAVSWASRMVGNQLTPKNVDQYVATLRQGIREKVQEHENIESGAKLNGKEAQLMGALDAALAAGHIEPQSALGNKFRAEHPPASLKGMNRTEISNFRIDWGKKLREKISCKSKSVKQWSRIDSTKFKYRPFGKVVIDLGGWSDEQAVRGALTGCMQCELLGAPYVIQHPQTKMPIYAIAEIGWQENFMARRSFGILQYWPAS